MGQTVRACAKYAPPFAQVSDLCDKTIEVFNFAAKTDRRSYKLRLFWAQVRDLRQKGKHYSISKHSNIQTSKHSNII